MELTANMEMVEVKVLEECQISPPSGSVPSTSLPLTFFDLVFLARTPSQLLLFYKFHNLNTTHFMKTILPNIKQSLSLTLQHFYPLAGNLIWRQESAKPEMLYEDGDAITFIVAETDHDFYHVSGDHSRDHNVFYPLSPVFSKKPTPLFAIQVTLFPNQGICIGFTFNHVAVDGRTLGNFMKSWASVCSSNGDTSFITDAPLYYNRSVLSYLHPNELINMEKLHVSKERYQCSSTENPNPNNNVQATFTLGRSYIKRLKHSVSSARVSKGTPLHFSSYALTCAYVWVCVIKARWGKTVAASRDAKEYLVMIVDAGARLNPPLPATYFGNCIFSLDVMAMRSELLGENGIAIAAGMIATEIQNLDIYRQIEKDLTYYFTLPPEQCLLVTGSPHFGVYGIDFGWGKPKKVEFTLLRGGNRMCLCESPNEVGAFQVGLVCSSTQMDSFATHFAKSLLPLSLI